MQSLPQSLDIIPAAFHLTAYPYAETQKNKNAAQHTSSQHRHQHHQRAGRHGGLPLFHHWAKGSSDGHNTARSEAAVVTTRVRPAQQTSKAVPACLLWISKPTAQAQQTSKAEPACLLCTSKPTPQCTTDKQAQPCASLVHFKNEYSVSALTAPPARLCLPLHGCKAVPAPARRPWMSTLSPWSPRGAGLELEGVLKFYQCGMRWQRSFWR